MKIGGMLSGLPVVPERARKLERAGFDALWAGEVNEDPLLSLAVAAGVTERAELGTSIAVAFARSPMSLAYTANGLQQLSGGRLLLGLGSQVRAHVVRRFSMPWSNPAARMREYVLALRAIWASWREGTPLAFEGEFYRHTLMPPDFVPPRHEHAPPRVLLAGVGERMTAVAGEVADGFLCHGYTTARWIRERTLPALRAGRAKAGLGLDGFEVSGTPFLVTGTEREIEAALPRVRARIAFYASTPAYRGVFELHGWDGLSEELTALSKRGRWDEMAGCISDEMVEAFALVASPAELPGRVAERFGGLLTRLTFTPPPSLGPEEITDLLRRLRGIAPAAVS